MAVGAHDDEVVLFVLGNAGDDIAGVANFEPLFREDAALLQVLAHGIEHFGSFLAVVLIHHFFAQHRAGARGDGGQHRQGREGVAPGVDQLIVSAQIGQHFFGVGATVNGQQNFHGQSPKILK